METSGEHELVAIAAELERYWSEQWRRAKEICDLLEQRLATRPTDGRPRLQLVTDSTGIPESSDAVTTPPRLTVVEP